MTRRNAPRIEVQHGLILRRRSGSGTGEQTNGTLKLLTWCDKGFAACPSAWLAPLQLNNPFNLTERPTDTSQDHDMAGNTGLKFIALAVLFEYFWIKPYILPSNGGIDFIGFGLVHAVSLPSDKCFLDGLESLTFAQGPRLLRKNQHQRPRRQAQEIRLPQRPPRRRLRLCLGALSHSILPTTHPPSFRCQLPHSPWCSLWRMDGAQEDERFPESPWGILDVSLLVLLCAAL